MNSTGSGEDYGGSVQRGTAFKPLLFFGIIGGVVLLDYVTKSWVQENMYLYQQIELVADYIRFTYIHNPGAAFGIHLGEHSRSVFLVLSFIALITLGIFYWHTPAEDRARVIALALICGGAIGNLIDRLRSELGVVDFIDLGIGDRRWPVFNIADIAVTTGAIFLALSLWREDTRDDRRQDERAGHPGRRRA
jgi:signal peptidase II